MSQDFIDRRPAIIDLVKQEIYGPLDSLSEETLSDDPLSRYFCGVLYPQKSETPIEEGDDGTTPKEADSPDESEDVGEPIPTSSTQVFKDLTDDEESYLNLSNAYKQSALSVSVAIPLRHSIKITIAFAKYVKNAEEKEWKRHPFSKEFAFSSDSLTDMAKKTRRIEVYAEKDNVLSLNGFYRWKDGDVYVFTFCLLNETTVNDDARHPKANDCFFQTRLIIESDEGLAPIPKKEMFKNPSEDTESNLLLYRNEKKYAVGHGCSPIWDDRSQPVKSVSSEFLPTYELKTVVPKNSTLSMEQMYKDDNGIQTIEGLRDLCDNYEKWINEQDKKTKEGDFESRYLLAAQKNIANCRECLERIREGISVLSSNTEAYSAFRLMNEAMLLQQIHSKLDKRKIVKGADGKYRVEEGLIPILEDKSTWKKGPVYGYWRDFQIAFILLSIPSIVDHESPQHGIVDLIWFPTGGGKTEAYLGLSAFTILYKRIKKKDDGDCVQIFMRYTLRLLTSQQYERAAALVCSLEHLRRESPQLLGSKPITIGLWVGGGTTPNTMQEAFKYYDTLNSNHSNKYPFVISKCPWCGAEIGPHNGKMFGIKKNILLKPKKKKVLYFSCSDPRCEFHADNDPSKQLPLHVVDEEIYENPPTFLIGTVDKFAILPYKPKAKTLFGLRNGPAKGRNHPELIIQDELHLISGPLGSTVSAYETMINFFCSYEEDGKMVRPKIIASTATISQAKRQCHELFDLPKEKVKIFPPSCIDNGETYFSTVSKDDPGREYVGIYAPGAQSSATSAIHILASHYEGKRFADYGGNDTLKDAYWTNVCYYNSIRELAQAVNWVDADIYEHSKIILHRDNDPSHSSNGIPRPLYMELNSRNQDVSVGESFELLSHQLKDDKPNTRGSTMDFCFATNMISVGIDIDRLGLMTVFGQPKTTSEYIQATSRVGRSGSRPGLVFVFYNPGKPRDKSIFENFEDFHSKFYSYVEPTSISPFCSELRSRVVPALVVGITRYIASHDSSNGNGFQEAYRDGSTKVAEDAILSRVKGVDPAEEADTKKQIDMLVDTWMNKQNIDLYHYPLIQGQDLSKKIDDPMPAICPDSEYPFIPDGWKKGTKPAPTSMRSVDLGCKLEINDDYGGEDYDG